MPTAAARGMPMTWLLAISALCLLLFDPSSTTVATSSTSLTAERPSSSRLRPYVGGNLAARLAAAVAGDDNADDAGETVRGDNLLPTDRGVHGGGTSSRRYHNLERAESIRLGQLLRLLSEQRQQQQHTVTSLRSRQGADDDVIVGRRQSRTGGSSRYLDRMAEIERTLAGSSLYAPEEDDDEEEEEAEEDEDSVEDDGIDATQQSRHNQALLFNPMNRLPDNRPRMEYYQSRRQQNGKRQSREHEVPELHVRRQNDNARRTKYYRDVKESSGK